MSGEDMEIDEETLAQALSAGVEFDLPTQAALYDTSRGSVRSRSSSADQLESRPHKVTMTDARFIFFLPSWYLYVSTRFLSLTTFSPLYSVFSRLPP